MKIGILTPNSSFIPFIAKDLPKALVLGLDEHGGIEYELYIEPTGNNADKDVLSSKIQELLIKHQVDVITAPLGVSLFPDVCDYFSGNQVPLIVNSLGEDVVFAPMQNPYIFVNSLNLWQSSWMAGYWGAERYGSQACSSCALHEGGYGMGFAFGLGLEAREGRLLQTVVTHRETRTEDPSQFINEIAGQNPDFFFGLYSGKEALSFLEAYDRLGYREKIPLLGLPPMVAEYLWDEIGDLATGIKYISSWDRNSSENRDFMQRLNVKTGHPANCYTLLAYETGQLIARAAVEIGADQPIGENLSEALKAVEFNGPRGIIKFDQESRETVTKDYLHEIRRGEDGQINTETLTELEKPELLYEQLALARKNLSKQGWRNPYLIG